MKMTTVRVNGKALKALIDSGSDQTLVHRQFIPSNVIIHICCVHGDKKPYPTADVYIEVQGQPYLLNIGVADNLPFPVVLGSDLPVLFDLLNQPQNCNVAITRVQAKVVDDPSVTLSALPFYDADLDTQPGKPRITLRQEAGEVPAHCHKIPSCSSSRLVTRFQDTFRHCSDAT